jgi:hypothetical protein
MRSCTARGYIFASDGEALSSSIMVGWLMKFTFLISVILLASCADQDRFRRQELLSNAELQRIPATTPISPPSPAEYISGDLDEIKAFMLKVLKATPRIENPEFKSADRTGNNHLDLEYGYEGTVMTFRISKSREKDHDVYTFATRIGGLSCGALQLHFRFVYGLGQQCGARTFIMCL